MTLLFMWIVHIYDADEKYIWIAYVVSVAFFVIGCLLVYRNRSPRFSDISWDSGTSQDCPSDISIPGKGGSLWNVNPFGPQSANAIATLTLGVLCAGPAFFYAGFRAVAGKEKEKK